MKKFWIVLSFVSTLLSAQTTTFSVPWCSSTAAQPCLVTPTDYKTFLALNQQKQNVITAANKLSFSLLSNVPMASGTSTGILLSTDWLRLNSAEQTKNKNQPNGYPGIDLNGTITGVVVDWGQLINVPQGALNTKLSQFTNDLPPPTPGPPGPIGPQGIPGPTIFAGLWNAVKTYTPGTLVSDDDGQSYAAMVSSFGIKPSTDAANGSVNWVLVAKAGTAGPIGSTGPQGLTGATGLQGPTGPIGPQGPTGKGQLFTVTLPSISVPQGCSYQIATVTGVTPCPACARISDVTPPVTPGDIAIKAWATPVQNQLVFQFCNSSPNTESSPAGTYSFGVLP